MKDNYFIRITEYNSEQEKALKSKGFKKVKCGELLFTTTDMNKWDELCNWIQMFEGIITINGGCVNDDYIDYLEGIADPRD